MLCRCKEHQQNLARQERLLAAEEVLYEAMLEYSAVGPSGLITAEMIGRLAVSIRSRDEVLKQVKD